MKLGLYIIYKLPQHVVGYIIISIYALYSHICVVLKHTVPAACFSNYLGSPSCLLPPCPSSVAAWSFWSTGRASRRAAGGVSVLAFLVGRGWRLWSHFPVCVLCGRRRARDCGVVSLNKMAARPLSTRAYWTPTMTVRSAVWIHTQCISPDSFLASHSR